MDLMGKIYLRILIKSSKTSPKIHINTISSQHKIDTTSAKIKQSEREGREGNQIQEDIT